MKQHNKCTIICKEVNANLYNNKDEIDKLLNCRARNLAQTCYMQILLVHQLYIQYIEYTSCS